MEDGWVESIFHLQSSIFHPLSCPLLYSCRSATIGSTFAARRAGM